MTRVIHTVARSCHACSPSLMERITSILGAETEHVNVALFPMLHTPKHTRRRVHAYRGTVELGEGIDGVRGHHNSHLQHDVQSITSSSYCGTGRHRLVRLLPRSNSDQHGQNSSRHGQYVVKTCGLQYCTIGRKSCGLWLETSRSRQYVDSGEHVCASL